MNESRDNYNINKIEMTNNYKKILKLDRLNLTTEMGNNPCCESFYSIHD
jgi:hypothetical protein